MKSFTRFFEHSHVMSARKGQILLPNETLLDSFNRINELGNKFWQQFYVNFLASDERVGNLFEGTDIMQQVTMMSQSTNHVVLNSGSFTPINSKLMSTLIHKHNVELAIPKELYAKWRESFLLTLEKLDPKFDVVLKGAWEIAIDHFLSSFIG